MRVRRHGARDGTSDKREGCAWGYEVRPPSSASWSWRRSASRPGRPCSRWSSGPGWQRAPSTMPGWTPGRSTESSPPASRSRRCSCRRRCRSISDCRSTSARWSTSAGPRSAGMVWRAAAAIELGLCDAVVCVGPAAGRPAIRPGPPPSASCGSGPRATITVRPRPSSRSLTAMWPRTRRTPRSPSATPRFGYDPRAMAKIAVDQRTNACANPRPSSTASPSPSTTCWPAP